MSDSVLEKFKSLKYNEKSLNAPLYEQIRKDIENLIITGAVPDNYRLPADKNLASIIGVHHVTLVKALNQLRNQGLLARSRGCGTFVKAPKSEEVTVPGERNSLVAVIFDEVNPQTFQSELFIALHDGLQKNGLEILFLSSSQKHDIQFEQISGMLQKPNCCACLVWSIMSKQEVAKVMEMKPVDFPLVFMDKNDPGIDCSFYDCFAASKHLGQIILDKKYSKIVYVAGKSSFVMKKDSNRFLALREVFEENNVDPENVIPCPLDDKDEFNFDELIALSKDAVVITGSPTHAIWLQEQITDMGHSLPELFPLISFGPTVFGKSLEDVGISEMRYYPEALGKNAIDILMARLNGDRGSWKRVSCGATFIERGSS